jgi:alginate O-acetyltransferase complex protein AlgI
MEFAIFLPIVFLLYWFAFSKNFRFQNVFIILSSLVFYAWWNWMSLLLVGISIIATYLSGLGIRRYQSSDVAEKRKWYGNPPWLICLANIVLNLAILCVFKYYDFFIQSFLSAFSLFGKQLEPSTLKLVLPLGISFYTLRVLSYSIDVYLKKVEPAADFLAFFAFIIFFPLLLAGPIERATKTLQQFLRKRVFDYPQAVDGMRQILWGLFKKAVIADNCAVIVNNVFAQNPADLNGSTLLLSVFFFTFQIYCDFSGYSDMAIGISKLLGIEVMQNFNYPYFSRNIAEFWRRWHISLTTWFRDYLYIPLGGSHAGKWKAIRNTFVIFLVSGLWHGANWTFIVWSFSHALLFLPLLLLGRNRIYTGQIAEGRLLPSIKEFLQMLLTFVLVMTSFVLFRTDTINGAVQYIGSMFSHTLFNVPNAIKPYNIVICLFFVVVMLIAEWFQREKQHALDIKNVKSHVKRYLVYISMAIIIFSFSAPKQTFIYMQF